MYLDNESKAVSKQIRTKLKTTKKNNRTKSISNDDYSHQFGL